ncbi:MAG: NAD(+)/NADH kinase [Anaerolineae bacterium]|nr:NAD(+)/NADH kinase [Phycisphaerales bacterium]MCA9904098.1 NAD(+)/NADH kinase [Anaerolineae bacterium]MCA9908812.1 NAD(+)/NADH kinase [Anaerolineae bacterium]
MTEIHRVGVFAHPLRPQSAPLAHEIAKSLQARHVEVMLHTQWDEDSVHDTIAGLDVVIAIGGDGAMLRAARVCAVAGVPVLGVNMGRLGFLTEIAEPNSWERALDRLFAGDYWIEQRMMLHTHVERDNQVTCEAEALNDVVLSRSAITRMVQLETYIDGGWTTTYNADALIIATATGSTAYALASGGPILPPELRNILIVPVAPHLTLDRPIVLQEGSTVTVVVLTDTESALSADGVLVADLTRSDRIIIQASEQRARFVRMRERNYFYRSLLDRLEPRVPPHEHNHLIDQSSSNA